MPPPALRCCGTDGRAAGPLVDIYRRPIPLLRAGQALAPHAHAMMDVSDGLLLDARRMAEASGCAIAIELGDLPLSSAFVEARGDDLEARLFAATGGDDYALLGAFAPDFDPATLSLPPGTRMVRIGAPRSRRSAAAARPPGGAGAIAGKAGF